MWTFLFVERKKAKEYQGEKVQHYFWRNYQQAEIDMIEKSREEIKAFEFKLKDRKTRTPKSFKEFYSTEAELISGDNYLDFLN